MKQPVASARLLAGLITLLCTGCSDSEEPLTCSATGSDKGAVITYATFARLSEDADDIAEGLNIDGRDSTSADVAACSIDDFVSPDGRAGIDNQFARILPLIEDFVGTENIDALLEAAIANGQLLLVINVEGVDDPMNDDCVDVTFGPGSGTPFLDTEGEYVAYQTFGFDRETAPLSRLPGRIENGVLIAGPGDVILPVRILDAEFNLHLHSAQFRFEIEHDQLGGGFTLSGYGGGGIEVADFEGIVADLNITDDIAESIIPLLGAFGDLSAAGTDTCTQVSAALRFRSVPAFVDETL